MVLSRLTKITGPGIRTDTNWVGNNANYTGILTASSFIGDGSGLIGVASTDNIVTGTAATFNTYPVDINAGMTVAGVATFAGNVSIAGTLTYEDVTNIDSVGIITARTGVVSPYADIDDFISVGNNIHLGNAGVITATSFVGSGAALTGIDATSIKDSGGNVKVQAQESGAIYTGIHTFNSDLDVDGHTNLDNVSIAGVTTMSGDLRIESALPSIYLTDSNSNPDYLISNNNGNVEIRDITNNGTRFQVLSSGTVRSFGNFIAAKDLDVDGHTNLDNVSIAGVVTATTIKGNGDGMSGIHTVATNPAVTPSNSLLAIGNAGSYRFIQSHGGQQLRINSAGNNVILPHNRTFIGISPANHVASITNNADNRVITGGTNGDIIGESNLTYNGNILTLNNDADQEGILMTGGDVYHTLTFDANRNIQNYSLGDVRGKWNGTEVNRIRFNTGADTTNRDEGWITFWTKPSGGGISERLRIGSDGNINITNNAYVAGIVTATTVQQRTIRFYGVTTTDRNALSSSEGDMIYNTTTNKHEVYTSAGNWVPFVVDPPVFDNNSGSLGTIYHMSRSDYSLTNPTATDTTGSITYSIISGSLPGGLSLNTSTAAITGTANSVGSDSTSTFTIKAENTGGSVSRQYSITVKAQVTSNYSYSGSTVTWTKPSGVRYVGFYMWGGGGSQGTCTSNGNRAGAGGNTTGIIDAQNHSALYLQVAQSGQNPSGSSAGGWPNGGEGNDEHQCKGGGGGGSSNIYNSSGTGSFGNLIAVAGGGGGVSHGNPNSNGGDGGGTNGSSSNRGGGGGSQNAGGSLGSTPCGNAGNAGSARQGGNAGTGTGCTNAGGGGGGGYYGGGAGGNSNGGNSYGGGGGGSGYYDTSLVSSGATRSYGESGWGSNKPSGIADRPSSSDQVEGGNGHITIYY